WVFLWDWLAADVTPGAHRLTAVADDKESAAVRVTVADVEAPTIDFASPAPGDTVSGLFDLTVEADDNVGVERIASFGDATSAGVVTAAPWRVTVDSASWADGSHTARAEAYDQAGNQGEATVSFETGPFTLDPLVFSSMAALPPQLSVLVDF